MPMPAARQPSKQPQRGLEIEIVCSGHLGKFLLDDAVCAGYLVGELQRQLEAQRLPLKKSNSALAVEKLYHSFPDALSRVSAFRDRAKGDRNRRCA